jgi:hypothetical protein
MKILIKTLGTGISTLNHILFKEAWFRVQAFYPIKEAGFRVQAFYLISVFKDSEWPQGPDFYDFSKIEFGVLGNYGPAESEKLKVIHSFL